MRETERQKRWAAGSITAYLCLVLILMLSLISGTIASVRNAHARVMTACAMEQGLYSLFAGYDRTLLGQYELFFYNGGDKSGVWKEEDAVGVVEVILILVVLIGLVLIFKKQLVSLVNSLMEKVTNQSNTV